MEGKCIVNKWEKVAQPLLLVEMKLNISTNKYINFKVGWIFFKLYTDGYVYKQVMYVHKYTSYTLQN
jgi:hypothetical protein